MEVGSKDSLGGWIKDFIGGGTEHTDRGSFWRMDQRIFLEGGSRIFLEQGLNTWIEDPFGGWIKGFSWGSNNPMIFLEDPLWVFLDEGHHGVVTVKYHFWRMDQTR